MDAKQLAPAFRARLFTALLEQHGAQEGWDTVFQLLNQGQRAAEAARMPGLVQKMEEGQTMVLQGLKDTGRFLDWELATLEVGLASGTISESYRRLIDHYRLQVSLDNHIKRQLRGPVLLVTLILAAMYGWLAFGGQLPVFTAAMNGLLAVVTLVLAEGVLVRYSRRLLSGVVSLRARRLAPRIPVLSSAYRAGQLLHFFRSLGQSVAAELPLLQSLKMAATNVPDPDCRHEFMAVHDRVSEGEKLSVALLSSGLLKGVRLPPINAGNAGGQEAMSYLVKAVSEYYAEQLERLARWIPQLLFVLLPVIAFSQVLAI